MDTKVFLNRIVFKRRTYLGLYKTQSILSVRSNPVALLYILYGVGGISIGQQVCLFQLHSKEEISKQRKKIFHLSESLGRQNSLFNLHLSPLIPIHILEGNYSQSYLLD